MQVIQAAQDELQVILYEREKYYSVADEYAKLFFEYQHYVQHLPLDDLVTPPGKLSIHAMLHETLDFYLSQSQAAAEYGAEFTEVRFIQEIPDSIYDRLLKDLFVADGRRQVGGD